MEIFGRAAAALARRAARTMQLGGAVIFGAVERDQHVIAQPAEGCEPATSFQRFDRSGKQRVEAFRRHRVQHRSEEHTSELQSRSDIVCRLLLEKNKPRNERLIPPPTPQSDASPCRGGSARALWAGSHRPLVVLDLSPRLVPKSVCFF